MTRNCPFLTSVCFLTPAVCLGTGMTRAWDCWDNLHMAHHVAFLLTSAPHSTCCCRHQEPEPGLSNLSEWCPGYSGSCCPGPFSAEKHSGSFSAEKHSKFSAEKYSDFFSVEKHSEFSVEVEQYSDFFSAAKCFEYSAEKCSDFSAGKCSLSSSWMSVSWFAMLSWSWPGSCAGSGGGAAAWTRPPGC